MVRFSRGRHALDVSMELFADNRRRLCVALRAAGVAADAVVLLQGGSELLRYNTDACDLPMRQESFFHWATGVEEPDAFAALCVGSNVATLFMPTLHPDFAIWHGLIHGTDYFKNKYEVDHVYFDKEMAAKLKEMAPSSILLLSGVNSDSNVRMPPATFEGIDQFKVDSETLYPIISECRVFKSEMELDVLRYVNKISSEAHKAMMKAVSDSMYEYQLESVFRHQCYFVGGCRHLAYTCIGATGPNCAVLHYGHANAPNERQLFNGDLCLFDMGAEYCCYASDITTTFPVSGKFTDQQKVIYNAVLAANRAVQGSAKPGVNWADMHRAAERVLLAALKAAGLLRGEVADMMAQRVGAVFMPHGLGHLMGLDVHDCGGFPEGEARSEQPGLCNLRTTRTLAAGMVITIEPGCYFIDTLLDKALASSEQNGFFVKEEIDKYRGFGGVRIEDDVIITDTGIENMTKVPRTVEEIEKYMAKK